MGQMVSHYSLDKCHLAAILGNNLTVVQKICHQLPYDPVVLNIFTPKKNEHICTHRNEYKDVYGSSMVNW